MAQDSILGVTLNTIGLKSRDKLAMEVASCLGLNLAYFDMDDIFTDTSKEIDSYFESVASKGVSADVLPANFSFLRIGNVMPNTGVIYLRGPDLETIGLYLARKVKGKVVLVGRGLTTLISDTGKVRTQWLTDLPDMGDVVLGDM
jgi:hypothetical protein